MSQADNLAALGSNVNASGVLQPASGGTGVTTSTGTGSVVLSSGATLTNATINGAVASGFTMKNRIINGDMVIDQRNNGASGTAIGYTVDRFYYFGAQASKGTWQQNAGSVTPPAGFSNYLGFTSSSAYSVISTDTFTFNQAIEGYNVADLGWGTANAKTVTLSFWVRSSLTGTFCGSFQNSASNRSYGFTYTISSANTWEQKSITIAGDTTGTWLTTNGVGIRIYFTLAAGSSYQTATPNTWQANDSTYAVSGAQSVVGTNGATWYITGVQLEQGSQATSFEWLPYSMELANCQRYYIKITDPGASGVSAPPNSARNSFFLPVTMRAAPTVLASGTFNFYNGGATSTGTVVAYYPGISAQIVQIDFILTSPFTTSQAVTLYTNGGSNFVSASAEL